MLDVSREKSDLFQKDVNAKEKYEGKQKTANANTMKLGVVKIFRTTFTWGNNCRGR